MLNLRFLSLLLGVLSVAAPLSAQTVGTAFTYQGELRQAGEPAGTPHDFEFRLFNVSEGGIQIGPTVSLAAVAVQDGLFSVELDFGAGQFAGDAQWLEVALRPAGGGDFQTLLPRTAVTAAPYALAALTALDGSVTSASIAPGAVGTSQINATQIQRRVTGTCPEGQYLRVIAQNGTVTCGSDATGVDWSRGGNAGTDASVDFLGTTDAQALEIRTANVRSLRIEPSSMQFNGSPTSASVVAGSHANTVDSTIRGGTVAGGGAEVDVEFDELGANEVRGDYGSVGGGFRNRAGDALSASGGRFATVAGGGWNLAPARASAVSGGTYNLATGQHSGVAGGQGNTANGDFSSVGGGNANHASASMSRVGGGSDNLASGDSSFVGGGNGNVASGLRGTVVGGQGNNAIGENSTVGGGRGNTASGDQSAIGGGSNNRTGEKATVSGGEANTASGSFGVVSGGRWNCAGGQYSWAGGHRAKVRPGSASGDAGFGCVGVAVVGSAGDQGSFVWADSQDSNFVSSGSDQFLVRAAGGVALNDSSVPNNIDLVVSSRTVGVNADLMLRPKTSDTGVNFGATSGGTLFVAKAVVTGNSPAFTNYAQWNDDGVFRLFVDNPVKPTAGGFAAPSDARLKQGVVPLDGALDRLLALRGVEFEYLPVAPAGFHAPGRHSGFIAQEVEQVFPDWVSEHSSGYKLVASKGFDALTVEALRELRIEKDLQIEALQDDNARLRAELAELRALVHKALTSRSGGHD